MEYKHWAKMWRNLGWASFSWGALAHARLSTDASLRIQHGSDGKAVATDASTSHVYIRLSRRFNIPKETLRLTGGNLDERPVMAGLIKKQILKHLSRSELIPYWHTLHTYRCLININRWSKAGMIPADVAVLDDTCWWVITGVWQLARENAVPLGWRQNMFWVSCLQPNESVWPHLNVFL